MALCSKPTYLTLQLYLTEEALEERGGERREGGRGEGRGGKKEAGGQEDLNVFLCPHCSQRVNVPSHPGSQAPEMSRSTL